MRKTPYMVALVGLLISLSMTLISLSLPYWLHADAPEDVPKARYVDWGLYKRCERRWVPSTPNGEVFREYKCRAFPTRSVCEEEGQSFCVLWSVAGYASQLGVVFACAALLSLTLANVTNKKRRRSAWRIISALVGVHGALQIVTMAIIVYLLKYRPNNFNTGTTYSVSFWLNVVSWVLDVFLVGGLVITAIFARKGHRWAAGRRPYQPIPSNRRQRTISGVSRASRSSRRARAAAASSATAATTETT